MVPIVSVVFQKIRAGCGVACSSPRAPEQHVTMLLDLKTVSARDGTGTVVLRGTHIASRPPVSLLEPATRRDTATTHIGITHAVGDKNIAHHGGRWNTPGRLATSIDDNVEMPLDPAKQRPFQEQPLSSHPRPSGGSRPFWSASPGEPAVHLSADWESFYCTRARPGAFWEGVTLANSPRAALAHAQGPIGGRQFPLPDAEVSPNGHDLHGLAESLCDQPTRKQGHRATPHKAVSAQVPIWRPASSSCSEGTLRHAADPVAVMISLRHQAT